MSSIANMKRHLTLSTHPNSQHRVAAGIRAGSRIALSPPALRPQRSGMRQLTQTELAPGAAIRYFKP